MGIQTMTRRSAGIRWLLVAILILVGSTAPSASTTLTGNVVVGDDPQKGVAGVTVTNPGPPGLSQSPDGFFSISPWPDSPNPTFALAVLSCGNSALYGFSGQANVVSAGTTDVGNIPLLGDVPALMGPDQHTLGSGSQSQLVAAADMNDDGYPDLVVKVGGSGGHKLRLLFGDGTGDFTLGPELTGVGEIASDLVAVRGSIGEGIIFYPNKSASSISHAVYYDSQFVGPFNFTTGDPAVAFGYGFWTGNGVDFIAATEPSGGGGAVVRVTFRNILDFDPPVAIHTTLGKISAIAVADLDGDTRADIFVVDRDRSECTVLLADTSGGFVTQSPFSCGVDPRDVAAADVDTDSDVDLVISGKVSALNSAGRITLLRNSGSGTFTASSLDAGSDLRAIAVGTNYMEPERPIFGVASPGDATVLGVGYDSTSQGLQVLQVPEDTGNQPVAMVLDRFYPPGLLSVAAADGATHVAFWTQKQVPGDGDSDGLNDLIEILRGSRCDDADTDDDGDDDADDTCPLIPNADQADSDGDGRGDVCDDDRDGDGVANSTDNCTTDPNADQADRDADSQGDLCDADDDGDGYDDTVEIAVGSAPLDSASKPVDTDNDAIPDALDPDDDNDGILDDGDASGRPGDSRCSGGSTTSCDDNCPLSSNAGQTDGDNDGVGTDCDNCPSQSNPSQLDVDGNSTGDACDTTPAVTAEGGFVTGRVTAGGSPLTSASVAIVGVGGAVVTGSSGAFTIPTPATGRFHLVASHASYVSQHRMVDVTAAERSIGIAPFDLLALEPTRNPDSSGKVSNGANDVSVTYPSSIPTNDRIPLSVTRFESNGVLPGPLPPSSHFTTAVHLGPSGTTFAAPLEVRVKVDNDWPAGEPVPVGRFDTDSGQWVHDGMGVVIKVGGDTYFKYLTTHFSSFDLNFPGECTPASLCEPPPPEPPPCDEDKEGAGFAFNRTFIGNVTGNLRTSYPLSGAHELVYRSAAAQPSYVVAFQSEPFSPTSANWMRYTAQVEGRRSETFFEPTSTGAAARTGWWWDGRNGRGERVPTGIYYAERSLAVNYPLQYFGSPYFGGPRTTALPTFAQFDNGITLSSPLRDQITVDDRSQSELGWGWSLSSLKRLYYDPLVGPFILDGLGAATRFSALAMKTIAGTGTGVDGADDIPAAGTTFASITSIATGPDGSIFIADTVADRARRIDPGGVVRAVPSTSCPSGNNIRGLTVSNDNILYFTCLSISGIDAEVRMLDLSSPSASSVVIAGGLGPSSRLCLDKESNGDPVVATSVPLNFPFQITIDQAGAVVFVEGGCHRVRRIRADGILETIAGSGGLTSGYSGDGGPATSARMNWPHDAAFAPNGDLFITDGLNHIIRRVSRDGTITRAAGRAGVAGSTIADGEGPALSAKLKEPSHLEVDSQGNVYFVDLDGIVVRRLSPDGTIETVAGGGSDQTGPNHPREMAFIEAALSLTPGNDAALVGTVSRLRALQLVAAEAGIALPSLDDESELVRNTNGTFTQTLADGGTFEFDSQGRLVTADPIGGPEVDYGYASNGLLSSITDASLSGPIGFAHSGGGLTITLPDATTLSLVFSAVGDLIAVQPSAGIASAFEYLDHLMVREMHASSEVRYEYDSYRRVRGALDNGNVVSIPTPTMLRGLVNDLSGTGGSSVENLAPSPETSTDPNCCPGGNNSVSVKCDGPIILDVQMPDDEKSQSCPTGCSVSTSSETLNSCPFKYTMVRQENVSECVSDANPKGFECRCFRVQEKGESKTKSYECEACGSSGGCSEGVDHHFNCTTCEYEPFPSNDPPAQTYLDCCAGSRNCILTNPDSLFCNNVACTD